MVLNVRGGRSLTICDRVKHEYLTGELLKRDYQAMMVSRLAS